MRFSCILLLIVFIIIISPVTAEWVIPSASYMSSSGDTNPAYPISNIIDGNVSSYWTTNTTQYTFLYWSNPEGKCIDSVNFTAITTSKTIQIFDNNTGKTLATGFTSSTSKAWKQLNFTGNLTTCNATRLYYAGGLPTLSELRYGSYMRTSQNLPIVSFVGSPLNGTTPLTVNFTDTSLNTPTTWNWSFGDQYYSQEQNPQHTYYYDGIYNVTLTVTNTGGSNSTTYVNYISVYGQDIFHLPVDVKDSYTHQYIGNIQVMLYDDKYDVFKNVTSDHGYTGFIHSGSQNQYNIELLNNYTVYAYHPDYQYNSTTAQFLYDYQLYTVYLTPITNETLSHMNVDVISELDNSYITSPTLKIYDIVHGVNYTATNCNTGVCGFTHSGEFGEYPLVYGYSYILFAEKEGYSSTSQEVVFSYDYQLFTLKLTSNEIPENTINIDIRDKNTDSLIEGADLSIYDYSYRDWRNYTCMSGQCFISYVGDYRPLKFKTTYKLGAVKDGYYSTYQDIVMSEQNQLFTIYLTPYYQPTSLYTIIPTQNITVLSQNTPEIPTTPIYLTSNLNDTFEMTIEPFQTFEPVRNTSGDVNITQIRQDILNTNVMYRPYLDSIDSITYPFYSFVVNNILAFTTIFGVNQINWVITTFGLMLVTLNDMMFISVLALNLAIANLPMKVVNTFTFLMVLDLIAQFRDLKSGRTL